MCTFFLEIEFTSEWIQKLLNHQKNFHHQSTTQKHQYGTQKHQYRTQKHQYGTQKHQYGTQKHQYRTQKPWYCTLKPRSCTLKPRYCILKPRYCTLNVMLQTDGNTHTNILPLIVGHFHGIQVTVFRKHEHLLFLSPYTPYDKGYRFFIGFHSIKSPQYIFIFYSTESL